MSDQAQNHDACIHCGARRVMLVTGKTSDMCSLRMNGKEHDGCMPGNLGLGGGDYIEFSICLECLRLQRTSPVGHTKFDGPRHRSSKAKRKPGEPLADLQSLQARWPGQCACGAAFDAGADIIYSLIARVVVVCPSCACHRAPSPAKGRAA